MDGRNVGSVLPCVRLLPNDVGYEVLPPEHLIHYDLQVVRLIVVNEDPDRAVFGEQVAKHFEARVHEREPSRVLQIVVIVLEGAPGIVGRVNGDAPDAPGVIRQQGFERVEVIPLNEQVLAVAVPVGQFGHRLQQPVRRARRGPHRLFPLMPVQRRHLVSFLVVGTS